MSLEAFVDAASRILSLRRSPFPVYVSLEPALDIGCAFNWDYFFDFGGEVTDLLHQASKLVPVTDDPSQLFRFGQSLLSRSDRYVIHSVLPVSTHQQSGLLR